jgi:hypothetical protein
MLLALAFLGQVGLGIERMPPPMPQPSRPPYRAVACSEAADPAIDSATQEQSGTSHGVDTFLIHVSIVNRGARGQRPTAHTIISVYREEERIAQMHIPRLDVGEAYAFTTQFRRAADAGPNSTTLLFRIGGLNYAPGSRDDCNERDNSFRLTF